MKELFRNIAKWIVICILFCKSAMTLRYELTPLHILAIGFFYAPIVKFATSVSAYPSVSHFVIWLTCFTIVFVIIDKLAGIKRSVKAD